MKMLNKLFSLLIVAFAIHSCSPNKEQQAGDATESTSDSLAATESVMVAEPEQGPFAGEYLVGDGNMYIVPVAETYEIQDGTGKASDVLYLQGKESDTVSVYSNKDKSVTFKMNPGHKNGTYHADGEQLPVELVGPLPE